MNGRSTHDHIPNEHWITLHEHSLLFSSKVPSSELPDYPAHLSRLNQIHHGDSVSICYNAYLAEPNHVSLL